MEFQPSLLLLAVLAAALVACDGKGKPHDDPNPGGVCSDQDGDGHGIGTACDGQDCDDTNPDVFLQADCEALCAVDGQATGCPCQPSAFPDPVICYAGDWEVLGRGTCHAGLRRCEGESWSPCRGQVLPAEGEVCDGLDEDCDGEIDDGVLNACGTCDEDCRSDCVGAGCDESFDLEAEAENLEACDGAPDCLSLRPGVPKPHIVWIANTAQGTLSKIDARERTETGRYFTSGLAEIAAPSRTSVDATGDVVVANQSENAQASVTRIAAGHCVDRDDDGVVTTSTGRDDVLPWGTDDCVIWSTDVGCPDDAEGACGVARGLAVQERTVLDGTVEPRVWVGLYNERRYVELDREDGAATGASTLCAPCTPNGAAIDRDGMLTSTCDSQYLCRFDTADPGAVEILSMPVGQNDAVTLDERGDIWLSGTVSRYEPATREWTMARAGDCGAPDTMLTGTGIALDGNGSLWIGACGETGLCRVDADTLACREIPAGTDAHGVAVDFDGFVWAIGLGNENAAVIDPSDEVSDVVLDTCPRSPPDSTGCLDGPDSYADMTGFQFRNATDPEGRYSHVFEGCAPGPRRYTDWRAVTFEVATPPGTSIEIAVRSAGVVADLWKESWTVVGTVPGAASPVLLFDHDEPGGIADGRYIEVRHTLLTESADVTPRLLSVGAQWSCRNIFQ